MSKASQFLTNAQRRNLRPDDVVTDGRMAGMTVRQVYEELLKEERGYEELYQSGNSGNMTLEEAINAALGSPDPQSYRVPYGPFAGMNIEQLIGRAQQQKEYLERAGVLPPTPEEPGMLDQVLPTLASAGSSIGGMYIANQLSGQAAANAAAAELAKAQTAAIMGKSSAGAATQAAVPTVTQPAAEAASSAVTQAAPAAAEPTGGFMNALWNSGPPVYGPAPQHSYGLLGLNSTVPGLAGQALTGAGLAAGAYTGLQQGKGLINALKGKDMSFQEEAALALPTFGLSFAVDPIKKLFGGGRHKDVYTREGNRGMFQDNTGIYEGNAIKRADGSSWDIGESDASYNIDWDAVNAMEGGNDRVAELDALVTALAPQLKDDKKAWQVGEFWQGANSGGDMRANIRAQFQNSGKSYSELRDAIKGDSTLSESDKSIYLAAVDRVEQFDPLNAGVNEAAQLPGTERPAAEQATRPQGVSSWGAPTVNRNAGRPAPGSPAADPLAMALRPTTPAAKAALKGQVAKSSFWGK